MRTDAYMAAPQYSGDYNEAIFIFAIAGPVENSNRSSISSALLQ